MNSFAITTCTLLLATVHVLLTPAFGATLMCRWVDDHGRTHITDIVPDRYTNIAICTDSDRYEQTADQLRDAQQRQALERSKAQREQAAEAADGKLRPADVAPLPNIKRPKEVVTDATDCITWWRIYDESSTCFGPFYTVRGIKAEAYDACYDVPSPEPKCGLRGNWQHE